MLAEGPETHLENPSMKLKPSLQFALLAGLLSAGFEAGRRVSFAPSTPDDVVVANALEVSEAFHRVSDRVGPSVVSVLAYDTYTRSGQKSMRQLQQGSGVVVDSGDGVVVTNRHVVAGADECWVALADGSRHRAEMVGTDQASDLAVLRVDVKGLTATPISDQDEARVGEWVLAFGNPLEIGHTVTAGIVSGLGRSRLGIAEYEDFIQTDAAINPGNSGGPLVNLEGRVVGINTAVGPQLNGSQGLGFAIPARIVRFVVGQLLEHGEVRRGWLGISILPFSPDQARSVGFRGSSRVSIERVYDDGPARRAGLRSGDVIQSIGGRTVVDTPDLMNAIAEIHPGTEVDVSVWRDGRDVHVPVRLAERPADAGR